MEFIFISVLFLGATNYPTTTGSVGKNLYLYVSFSAYLLTITYLQHVRTVGSLIIQEDYATNIFLLGWPGKRLANIVKRPVVEILPPSRMKIQIDFSKL